MFEEDFRKSQKETDTSINELKNDIQALKITLIGIDGQNGMRSQINNLFSELAEIRGILSSYMESLSDIRAKEARCSLVFSTKKELEESEDRVLAKLDEMKDELESDRKEREKEKEERQKHVDNLKTSRWILGASILGILASSVISLL